MATKRRENWGIVVEAELSLAIFKRQKTEGRLLTIATQLSGDDTNCLLRDS